MMSFIVICFVLMTWMIMRLVVLVSLVVLLITEAGGGTSLQ